MNNKAWLPNMVLLKDNNLTLTRLKTSCSLLDTAVCNIKGVPFIWKVWLCIQTMSDSDGETMYTMVIMMVTSHSWWLWKGCSYSVNSPSYWRRFNCPASYSRTTVPAFINAVSSIEGQLHVWYKLIMITGYVCIVDNSYCTL